MGVKAPLEAPGNRGSSTFRSPVPPVPWLRDDGLACRPVSIDANGDLIPATPRRGQRRTTSKRPGSTVRRMPSENATVCGFVRALYATYVCAPSLLRKTA